MTLIDPFSPILLSNNGATAELLPHGAHVTKFSPLNAEPVLWSSKLATYQDGKAIRGGIPIIWPWFGAHPTDPEKGSHGVARKMAWQRVVASNSAARFRLLPVGTLTHPQVDGEFEATVDVKLDEGLTVSLITRNAGESPFQMTAALHTYFAVGDVTQIKLTGLEGRTYVDQLDGNQRKLQTGAIKIDKEVDRIYLNSDDVVEIHDPLMGRIISVAKEGSMSTVVWNPWIDKSKRMADFGDDEYLEMVCVETCNAADDARTLQPGESHTLTTKITVKPL